MLSLLELLAFMHVVDDREDVEAVAAEVEHLQVALDLILRLLPQRHLLLDALAERRELIVVIIVRLLPEHSQETSLSLFTFLFPVLGVDGFEALLGDAVGEILRDHLVEVGHQVILRLLLIDEHYLLKNIDDPFEVTLRDVENAQLGTFVDEFNIFLLNLIVQLVE